MQFSQCNLLQLSQVFSRAKNWQIPSLLGNCQGLVGYLSFSPPPGEISPWHPTDAIHEEKDNNYMRKRGEKSMGGRAGATAMPKNPFATGSAKKPIFLGIFSSFLGIAAGVCFSLPWVGGSSGFGSLCYGVGRPLLLLLLLLPCFVIGPCPALPWIIYLGGPPCDGSYAEMTDWPRVHFSFSLPSTRYWLFFFFTWGKGDHYLLSHVQPRRGQSIPQKWFSSRDRVRWIRVIQGASPEKKL